MLELVIDIGNTSISFALYSKDNLTEFLKLSTKLDLTTKDLSIFLKHNLKYNISKSSVSSVVPILNSVLETAIFDVYGVKTTFISFDLDYDLSFSPYSSKKFLLGSDIFSNLIAAVEHYNLDSALVADFGTACTIFSVTRNDGILGGLIAPGPLVSFKALTDKAYLLKEFDLKPPSKLLGSTTESSINSGILYQYKYLLEGVLKSLMAKYNKKFNLIITGGNSPLVTPLIEVEFIHNIHLTVEGIRILSHKVKDKLLY